ncbi:cytochrome P450 [Coprinopsis marcescibilis]|uniref:Cytochrome P450 n=1 Tax=Coprinopsis marcescibilis TaxID=230819 RepID=A0A5C3L8H5_COPMA|nr:cytochrome P450 [Coprinopsis marcescibilis]
MSPFLMGVHQVADVALVVRNFALPLGGLLIAAVAFSSVSSRYRNYKLGSLANAVPGLSFLSIMPFFHSRFDFLNWGFHATGQQAYSFNLLWNKVTVVSGESAREAIFTFRGLNLLEAFKFVSGSLPVVRDADHTVLATVQKRLTALQRNASLSDLIPQFLEDIRQHMDRWSSRDTIDPFDEICELGFHTSVRALAAKGMADDYALIQRLRKLYDDLDESTTPATVLFPLFPSPAMIKKVWAAKQVYDVITKAIDEREGSGIRHNDTLQMLLDAKDDRFTIIGFIMGLIIAGARATGVTASWMLIYLGGNPEWRAKAVTEIETLLRNHSSSASEQDPLSTRLSTIPLEAWESEAPVLDSVIREITRIAQPHIAMRLNEGPDVLIDNKLIPHGSYVLYPFSDVHLDPEIYSDPWTFNPGRPEPTSTPLGYVGFGGARSVCAGQRLAKLELKLIVSMYILGYDHGIVKRSDTSKPVTHGAVPRPNWNEPLTCRPADKSDDMFFAQKRTARPF